MNPARQPIRYERIASDKELATLCDALAGCASIALDTEFVSEDTYRPELCLIQVEAGAKRVVIDPFQIEDVTPFWRLIVRGAHQTIMHAAREEMAFCLRLGGGLPADVFDTQIAAGFVGFEFPTSYAALLNRVLSTSLSKHETRTDWRRRPLSKGQLQYAMQDVVYLHALRDALVERLTKAGRLEWFQTEMRQWRSQLEIDLRSERWWRMASLTGLSARQLAIVRELWRWREAEAERENRPVRRVLRDDLLVELARRGKADLAGISAIRGMQNRDLRKRLPSLAEAIQRGNRLQPDSLPEPPQRDSHPQLQVLCQFLATVTNAVCRGAGISPGIVGTVADLRELVAYRLGLEYPAGGGVPRLAQGWRHQLVGDLIEGVLQGKVVVRIGNPLAESPLCLERLD